MSNISWVALDDRVWEIEKRLWAKYGMRQGQNLVYPLKWWIRTGRASTGYLHKFMEAKPFMVARILERSHTEEEAVKALTAYLDRQK